MGRLSCLNSWNEINPAGVDAMTIENFTPLSGFAGGLLIGLAVVLLLWLNGRIAGISGIVAGVVDPLDRDALWRWSFIAGLVLTALAWPFLSGNPVDIEMEAGPIRAVLAGLLVGFGSRLGCGCTSGHGVAGLARLSPRSAVAVVTFFAVAVVTATVTGYVLKGGAG